MYDEKVIEHFRNPKHVGEIENADGKGEEGNAKCGDIMLVTIRVKDNTIQDAKFKTFGCVAAIASSDVVCELAVGKTLEQAMALKEQDVIDYLGNLPAIKIHCSILGIAALRKAIDDYRKNKITGKSKKENKSGA